MPKKIVAIIQARFNSSRFPGKVLSDIQGQPALAHVINRIIYCKLIGQIVVATTVKNEDLAIVELCRKNGWAVYCGSEDDVLDRYYQAARSQKADHIARITGDCPMIDPDVVDDAVRMHLETQADYTSNTLNETYPDGEDVEVFTFKALEKAWKNARLLSEREHVTPYIKKNPRDFIHASLERRTDLSSKRWTLDTPEDYEFIKAVYQHLFQKNSRFGMQEILEFLEKNPETEKINGHIVRNEGYLKSLREDRLLGD